MDSGRPEAVAKQHSRDRMTARERIDALCDAESYREIGDLVEPVRDTSFNADLVAPADGVVIGTAKLDGRYAMVTAHDFTVLGGSTGVVGADKTNRAVALATERGIPLVMLLEGGGHRIQDGQDSRHSPLRPVYLRVWRAVRLGAIRDRDDGGSDLRGRRTIPRWPISS